MGRAPCCSKVGLNRGPWTPEEDMLLSKHIEAHGEGNWRALPKSAGLLRCGKSCRLRWVNYLRPNVKRGNISEDEEDLIIMLHGLLGNRWSLIAARMPGRTDNEIKNYWNTHLSKKLASRGLDPKTHKPISSKTSSVQKKSEELQADDDPQEAWETTMDLDTSSYSAGSCDDGDADLHHRHGLQSKASQKKRQIPEQPQQKKQQIGPVSCANASSKDGGREEQNDKLQLHKQNKFDCPSPSSVLNIYSPSASNTGSNCDSPGISSARATSTSSSVRSHNSSFSSAAPIHDQHLTRDDDHKQQQQQTIATATDDQQQFMEWEEQMQAPQLDVRVQMLEFIDEFLCKEDQDAGIDPHAANLFKEDEGSEFWDSLGKIELPDCSSVCQSDLWDGLTDLVPDHASSPAVAAPSSPQFSFLDSSSQLPLITDLNSSSSSHLPQDGIAELLFCA